MPLVYGGFKVKTPRTSIRRYQIGDLYGLGRHAARDHLARRVQQYGETMVSGIREVIESSAAAAAARERIRQAQQQLEAAEAAQDLAMKRVRRGTRGGLGGATVGRRQEPRDQTAADEDDEEDDITDARGAPIAQRGPSPFHTSAGQQGSAAEVRSIAHGMLERAASQTGCCTAPGSAPSPTASSTRATSHPKGIDRWWARGKGATPRGLQTSALNSAPHMAPYFPQRSPSVTASPLGGIRSSVWDRLSQPAWMARYGMAMGATSGGASPTGTERVYVDLANRDLTNDGTSDARHPYDPILGNPAWRPVRSADGRAAWRARQFAKARGDYRRHAAFAEQNSQAQRRGASGESAGGVTASQISSHGVSGASQISSHGVSGGLSGGVHPSSATPRGSSATPRRSTPRAKSATPRSTAKQPTPRRSAQDSARRRSASPRSARSGQGSSAAMDAQYSARTAQGSARSGQGSARASGFGSARMSAQDSAWTVQARSVMSAQDSAWTVQARSVMPGYTGHVARSRDVFFQSWHTPEVHVATGKQTGAEEAVELGGGTTSGLHRVGEALTSTRKGPAGPTCTTGIEAPFGKAEHPGIEAPFGKAEHPVSYSCFMPKTSNVVEGTPIALPTPTAFPTATRILSAKRDPFLAMHYSFLGHLSPTPNVHV